MYCVIKLRIKAKVNLHYFVNLPRLLLVLKCMYVSFVTGVAAATLQLLNCSASDAVFFLFCYCPHLTVIIFSVIVIALCRLRGGL